MTAPSKMLAAAFLRHLARDAGKPLADPKRRAEDLRLIADCFEGKVKWRKSPKHEFDEKLLINQAAYNVEYYRRDGESVNAALDRAAKSLARELRRADDPDAEQELRDDIVQARKARRKAIRDGELEK